MKIDLHKIHLGVLRQIERAFGVWYPDPDADLSETNSAAVAAFREYVMMCLDTAYSRMDCGDREVGEPDLVCIRNVDTVRFDPTICY
ncbi:MAG: hypothetical protein LBU24_05760 [Methanocalculaceae archaeon]|jgi:hypothetical protein|nr:hypothetical protein [Methanocalculaceae archaeon]